MAKWVWYLPSLPDESQWAGMHTLFSFHLHTKRSITNGPLQIMKNEPYLCPAQSYHAFTPSLQTPHPSPSLPFFLEDAVWVRNVTAHTWLSIPSSAIWLHRPEPSEIVAAAAQNFWACILRVASKICAKDPWTLWCMERGGWCVREAWIWHCAIYWACGCARFSTWGVLSLGRARGLSPALKEYDPITTFQGWRVEGLPLSSDGFGAFFS